MEKTTAYAVTPTAIPGLLLVEISSVEDDRGWFQEKYQKEKLTAAGLPAGFQPVQQNISFNREPGVTRGLHAEPWEKYVSVVRGKVFAAYVDLRAGDHFGKTVTVTIDPGKAVFVPRGVANSFQTLEPETYYSYLVNSHWSPDARYVSVNLADPDLGIVWPIPLAGAVISDKDRKHPQLKNIQPF
ncbi:MAG: dTDP-4-dehydrorhamnose 3,5-epimerase family protein [Candidatus Saccharibacteria bacterium]